MKLTINGETRELPDGLTVAAMLELLGAPLRGVAVSCNERVVTRVEYDSRSVAEGDRIEIIKAVAGG